MKNLRQLGLILSVGTLAALVITGCSDDATPTPGGTAGSGGSGTSGSGTTGGGGSGTSGSTATGGGGSKATGGTGGSAAGGGGAATGGGGAATGGGGAATGGGGAATGGGGAGGSGGSGGSGGAAHSADCTKWCVGADSVLTVCAQNNIPDKINSEQKCLDVCDDAPAASVTCWVMHTGLAKTGDKGMHCPHGEGAANQVPANTCPQLP